MPRSQVPATPFAGDLATTARTRHPQPQQQWPYSTTASADQAGLPANGWWVKVTLDLETGDVVAEPSTGHQHPHVDPLRAGEIYVAADDSWARGRDWSRWPRRLVWLHNMRPMNRRQVVEMLDWVETHAQALLDALTRLPGGGYDWTREAVAQFWHIKSLVANIDAAQFFETRGELKDHQTLAEGIVTFDEVTAWYPHLVDPAWATLDDDSLDAVALRLTQTYPVGASAWISWELEQDIAVEMHWGEPVPPGHARGHYPVSVVAARAGLRALRDQAVAARAGLPAQPTQRWLCDWSGDGPVRWPAALTESTTDAELGQLAREIETLAAEQDQVALTGAEGVLERRREGLRRSFRERLQIIGAQTEAARREYEAMRSGRESMLAQVIGWNEPGDRNPDGSLRTADLSRLASCSRQAVAQLAERMGPDATDEPAF